MANQTEVRPRVERVPVEHATTEPVGSALPSAPVRNILALSSLRRVSWGAIFAGAFMAYVVQITLSLLGMAIGLAFVNPNQGVGTGMGIGAAIWWTVSGIISLFVGGYLAAYLAGYPRRGNGAVHGLVVWAVCAVAALFLFTTVMGGLFMGATQIAQAGVTAAGSQAGQAVRDNTAPGATTDQDINQAAQDLRQTGRDVADQARNTASNVGEKVRQAAGPAARVGAKASLGAFIMLILGGGAAALGGSVGAPKHVWRDVEDLHSPAAPR